MEKWTTTTTTTHLKVHEKKRFDDLARYTAENATMTLLLRRRPKSQQKDEEGIVMRCTVVGGDDDTSLPALQNESAWYARLGYAEHTLITSAACNNLFTFFSPLQSCQMVPDRARVVLPPY